MMAQSYDINRDSGYKNFSGNKKVEKETLDEDNSEYEMYEKLSDVTENVQGVKADVSPRSSDPTLDIPEVIPDSFRRHSTSSATPSRVSAAFEALQ